MTKKQLIVNLLIGISLLSGCSTGYHKSSFMGGFSEMQIDSDIYEVDFGGNSWTEAKRVDDFSLLRCAELTLEKGYKYFTIFSEKVVVEGAGNALVPKPTASKKIKLLKEKPIDSTMIVYDAEQIKISIKEKYHVK